MDIGDTALVSPHLTPYASRLAHFERIHHPGNHHCAVLARRAAGNHLASNFTRRKSEFCWATDGWDCAIPPEHGHGDPKNDPLVRRYRSRGLLAGDSGWEPRKGADRPCLGHAVDPPR